MKKSAAETVIKPAMYSVPEVAKLLACAESTVRAMTTAGTLPSVRVGRLVRIPRAALDEFISCAS